jgi:hypothetical protein
MLKRFGLAVGLVFSLGIAFALGQAAGIGITGTDSAMQNSIFHVGMLRITRTTAFTALAGGAQVGASQLVYGLNRIATVGSSGDSMMLPTCIGGKMVVVANAAASNASNIFPQVGDAINALAVNSPFSLAANKVAIFFCTIDGTWASNLTASLDPRLVGRGLMAANDNHKAARRAA